MHDGDQLSSKRQCLAVIAYMALHW